MQDNSENVSRWDRRRAQTYQRLLEAGERLFRLNGFETTTVEEVAAAADVAKGTFFNYFASKEALLGGVLYWRLLSVFEASRKLDSPPEDRIWDLLVAARHELLPYLHLFRQMFAYVISHPGIHAPDDHGRTLGDALAQIVKEGQAESVFRPEIDAPAAGALIATLFFRLAVLECAHTERAPQESPLTVVDCEPGGEAEIGFCWESHMRAGLQIIYRGLEGQ